MMPLNSPRTVEIIRCFTAKLAAVCAGSICQVVVAAAAGNAKAAARVALSVILESNWPMWFSFFSCRVFDAWELFGCVLRTLRCFWNDFFQGTGKRFEPRCAHILELPFVK